MPNTPVDQLSLLFEKLSFELERIETSHPNSGIIHNLTSDQYTFSITGIDSESIIDKNTFEKYLEIERSKSDKLKFLKALIHADISDILDTLKNTLSESIELYSHYLTLLQETSLTEIVKGKNGTIVSKSKITTLLTAIISSSVIKMVSSLDILVKYCRALEDYDKFDYKKYHRLNNKVLFNDAKHLKKIKNKFNTIFQKTDNIKILISLRDDLIHNNTINSFNRVYVQIRDSKEIDKYILFPDHKDGVFIKSNNRNRFFSQEVKTKDILLKIYGEVMRKMISTLQCY